MVAGWLPCRRRTPSRVGGSGAGRDGGVAGPCRLPPVASPVRPTCRRVCGSPVLLSICGQNPPDLGRLRPLHGRQGSNLRHAVLETAALPTELRPYGGVLLRPRERPPGPGLPRAGGLATSPDPGQVMRGLRVVPHRGCSTWLSAKGRQAKMAASYDVALSIGLRAMRLPSFSFRGLA